MAKINSWDTEMTDEERITEKIGRASCRERV